MSRHYPPVYLRYLKARLWNLARPSFWGTAIFLAVVGMGVYEYWTNPDFLSKWQQKSANSSDSDEYSISDADKFDVADIDNLPVILNDRNRAKTDVLSTVTTTIPKTQKGNKTIGLDKFINKQKNPTDQTKLDTSFLGTNPQPQVQPENPFLTQTENLLRGNNSQTGNNLLGANSFSWNYLNPQVTTPVPILGVGLNTKNNTNNINIPITSPLQTAIKKSLQSSPRSSLTTKLENNFGINNPPNQTANNNTGFPSPGVSNLPRVTSYNQPPQIKQQPNTSNFNPGYIQPKLTNQQPNNNLTNIPVNQQFRTNYSQPNPAINLNSPRQQSSAGYIQPGVKNQSQMPIQPLPKVTSPSTNYSPPFTNQGIPKPNNYDNTVWEQLIPRSDYNRIKDNRTGNN
ncbi:MAG: hypothetical protein QNJ63_25970 [Calothrix sp. MO_192.B10]|nr:hypothetical protein [Calothrix sp. MO_192.B10]